MKYGGRDVNSSTANQELLVRMSDKELPSRMPPKTEALHDRITKYDSPNQESLKKIAGIEYFWKELVEMVLVNCPDNREREKAIEHLETAKNWTRSSIIRGD
jgi:hypothetical protein